MDRELRGERPLRIVADGNVTQVHQSPGLARAEVDGHGVLYKRLLYLHGLDRPLEASLRLDRTFHELRSPAADGAFVHGASLLLFGPVGPRLIIASLRFEFS